MVRKIAFAMLAVLFVAGLAVAGDTKEATGTVKSVSAAGVRGHRRGGQGLDASTSTRARRSSRRARATRWTRSRPTGRCRRIERVPEGEAERRREVLGEGRQGDGEGNPGQVARAPPVLKAPSPARGRGLFCVRRRAYRERPRSGYDAASCKGASNDEPSHHPRRPPRRRRPRSRLRRSRSPPTRPRRRHVGRRRQDAERRDALRRSTVKIVDGGGVKAEFELDGVTRTVTDEKLEGDVLKLKVQYEGGDLRRRGEDQRRHPRRHLAGRRLLRHADGKRRP